MAETSAREFACPMCAYPLPQQAATICPECGYGVTADDLEAISERTAFLKVAPMVIWPRWMVLYLFVTVMETGQWRQPFIGSMIMGGLWFLFAAPAILGAWLVQIGRRGLVRKLSLRVCLLTSAWSQLAWLIPLTTYRVSEAVRPNWLSGFRMFHLNGTLSWALLAAICAGSTLIGEYLRTKSVAKWSSFVRREEMNVDIRMKIYRIALLAPMVIVIALFSLIPVINWLLDATGW